MKALTLTQPWASLVAISAKKIETRSWRTAYRGPLAIHAAKGFPKGAQDYLDSLVFFGAFKPKHAAILKRVGLRLVPKPCKREVAGSLPVGAVIATCRLISCLPTRELQHNQIIETDLFAKSPVFKLDDQERTFGDYSPGRWAWLLADVQPCEPIPARGALSLWEWDGGPHV
jgi:hypothetical protein